MIDTHSHLWFNRFNGEVSEVLERAKKVGVHTIISVGCDESSSRASSDLAGEFAMVYAAVGLHPTEGKDWKGHETIDWMRNMIESSDKIVAVGETGIDYYHKPYNVGLQQEMLREQCLLAQQYNLPVIIHLRQTKHTKDAEGSMYLAPAEMDCLQVLDEVAIRPGKVLFHCFSGDRHMAHEVLKRGFMISFSGVLTYPHTEELHEVVKMTPFNRMVVETDCPFLSPQSHRGERNEPAFVVEVAQMIAALKDVSSKELEKILDENARIFFGL